MKNQPSPQKRYLKLDALSALRSGDIDSAIKKYEQYLDLNPGDDDAWAGLGGAYKRTENLKKAIDSYEKAYEINPESSYALVNLISIRAAQNIEEDKEMLKKYIPKAVQIFHQIINNGKGDFWTWYDLGTIQLIKGEAEEAIKIFNYAAELTPKTALENFRSVLNNLMFLKEHNPNMKGISKIIDIIRQHLD